MRQSKFQFLVVRSTFLVNSAFSFLPLAFRTPRFALFTLGCGLLVLLGSTATASGDSELLMDGKAALEDELYDLAQKKIEQYLKTGTPTPAEKVESALLLAQALHGQKRYQDMLDLLGAGKEQAAGTPQAAAFDFWMAMAYFELRQWPQALDCIRDFEKKYPASPYLPRVLRLLAWSYMNLGKQGEAIDCFARFADRYGNTPEGPANLLDGAKVLIVAGHRETARNVLEKLVALNLEDRVGQEGRSLLGRIYLSEKKWDQVRQVVAPLMDWKNVPDEFRASAFFSLAEIAEAQTNLVEALSLLDKGAEHIADSVLKDEINLRKGKLLLKMGKMNEGIALVRGFVSSQTTNMTAGDAQMELAQTLLNMGLNEKALVEFQNYLEAFSHPEGILRAHQGKGWALFHLGRYIEAAASFEKAFDLSGHPEEKAQYRFKVGDCHFAGEQYKLAMESYERVIAQCPETSLAEQAQFQIAECRARMGDLAEAVGVYWDLADRDRGSLLAARALLRVAELRQKQGQWQDARDVYQQVLTDYSGSARTRAIQGMGVIDYRLGRYEEALARFNDVLQSYPDSEVADISYYFCGWCHFMLGRNDQAVSVFRDFIRRYPKSAWAADALFWLAEYDYNRGVYYPAEATWMTMVRDYPKSPVADKALFLAGRAALKQNEFHRARDHFSMLIKDYPTSPKRPEARFYQGEAMCELGEFAGAILIFDEIIKQFPDSDLAEAAWFRKGDSQFTLGAEAPKRYEEAVASYQLIMDRPNVSELSKMQAEYKTGRSFEKMGRPMEAFEHYMKVVYSYFKHRELKPQGDVWFTRAAFNAAGLKEDEKSWRKAATIYQRVVDAQVPASRDAKERINKIRAEYWMFFY